LSALAEVEVPRIASGKIDEICKGSFAQLEYLMNGSSWVL